MKNPCKDCIVLAACKQKEEIRCKKLYDYVVLSNGSFRGASEVNELIVTEAEGHIRLKPTGIADDPIVIVDKRFK